MKTAKHCLFYLTCKGDSCEDCDNYEPDYPCNPCDEEIGE